MINFLPNFLGDALCYECMHEQADVSDFKDLIGIESELQKISPARTLELSIGQGLFSIFDIFDRILCGCPPLELYALVITESAKNNVEAEAITAIILNRVKKEREASYGTQGWNGCMCPLDIPFQLKGRIGNYVSLHSWATWDYANWKILKDAGGNIVRYNTSRTWIDFIGGTASYRAYLDTPYKNALNAITANPSLLKSTYKIWADAVDTVWNDYLSECLTQKYSKGAWFWAQGVPSGFTKVNIPGIPGSSPTVFYSYTNDPTRWP